MATYNRLIPSIFISFSLITIVAPRFDSARLWRGCPFCGDFYTFKDINTTEFISVLKKLGYTKKDRKMVFKRNKIELDLNMIEAENSTYETRTGDGCNKDLRNKFQIGKKFNMTLSNRKVVPTVVNYLVDTRRSKMEVSWLMDLDNFTSTIVANYLKEEIELHYNVNGSRVMLTLKIKSPGESASSATSSTFSSSVNSRSSSSNSSSTSMAKSMSKGDNFTSPK